MELQDLVWEDGSVRLADAAFPVDMSDTAGTGFREVKAMLIQEPNSNGWWLGFWAGSLGNVDLLSLRKVASVVKFHPRERVVELDDGVVVTYTPSVQCGCGSTLRSYRPWGNARQVGVSPPVI